MVAKLVGPPQSGHVARGELSPNVLSFLADLQANNDRDWFARYDAVYRYCWANFGAFAEAVLNDIMEQVDDTVPWLPVKDLVYRIYRDVRFSNDKTPALQDQPDGVLLARRKKGAIRRLSRPHQARWAELLCCRPLATGARRLGDYPTAHPRRHARS